MRGGDPVDYTIHGVGGRDSRDLTGVRSSWLYMRRAALPAALALSLICAAAPLGMADNCMIDVWYNGDAGARMLFPNWKFAYQGTFTVLLDLNGFNPEYLTGVTVVNFGDAMQGTEIQDVYIRMWAGAKDADSLPIDTMTYVGMWTFDDGMGGTTQYPAWTWGGYPTVQLAYGDDYCSYNPACGKFFTLSLYTDIAPCPAEGKTVNLGFPSAEYLTPDWPGSIHDIAWTVSAPGIPEGCVVPWWATDTNRGADADTIVWGYKIGPDQIGPGDTVNYTIYFGLPGAGNLTYVDVTDTLPPYMHYVMYSGTPAPAPGWDPDPGPPVRLKWSYGATPTIGGPTNMITYAATVDWGNTESFEPGSGDIAAPEAFRLINSAQIAFGASSCVKQGMVTEQTSTVVKRFLFWKLGDNDMLFASSIGKPNDEMIYSIFMKNVSSSKTWWNVTIWDTVPAEVDVWCADCGMEDPCVGWTITPTGCAAASAGKIITGAKNTILTWHLDMQPQYTLTVRWKAQLKSTVLSNSTVINRASIQGMGKVAIVDGTGNTGVPRNFTHLALVKLRTTYTSYVAYAGDSTDKGLCPGLIVDFFPLNKATQFELRGIQYTGGGGWAEFGGVSQSIGCIIGDCVSGFSGNAGCTLGSGNMILPPGAAVGASPAMGAGCKAERIPAFYIPSGWVETCIPTPFNFIYKITSNSPVTWQMLTLINNCNQDRHTYAPSSNLSYIGYMLYTWRSNMPDLSSFSMINTSDTSITTVHLFRYDYTITDWAYQKTYELAIGSQATDMGCTACGDYAPWRIISSDTPLIVNVGESSVNTAGCCCGQGSDNHMALAPTRETGFVTGIAGQTFYAIANPMGVATSRNGCVQIGWGKTTAAPATIEIYGYTPLSSFGNVRIPSLLRDTAGTWGYKGTFTLDPGLAVTANNPILFLATPFNRGSSNLFKARVTSGGPIIINTGTYMFSHWSGGTVIHSWDIDKNVASPSGAEFWLTQTKGNGVLLFTNIFTPETGVRIGMYSNDGASAEYTTNGTDQCVAFRALTDFDAKGATAIARNTVIVSKTAGTAMIAMFQANRVTEKGFTAPFLSTGTYYDIISPPTAFIGEEFWITIYVRSELGGIVTNYTGTTSFSSTDPAAKVEASSMDSYNYTWSTGDKGVKLFYRVSFTKLGMQTLVASDVMDGSIVGLASVMVVGVDVRLFKEPRLSTAASGDTVTFKICWSNYSSASALSFVITDSVPRGTIYVAQAASNHICGTTSTIAYDFAYSTSQSSSPPAGGSWTTTTGTPAGSVYWLRWTIKSVGIDTTGCACFKVQVD